MKDATRRQWHHGEYWNTALPIIRELLEAKQPEPFSFVPFFSPDDISPQQRPAVDAAIAYIDSEARFNEFLTFKQSRMAEFTEKLTNAPEDFHAKMTASFEEKHCFPTMIAFAGTEHLTLRDPQVLHDTLAAAARVLAPQQAHVKSMAAPHGSPSSLKHFFGTTLPAAAPPS